MKKVLLTTSALTLLAGAAAADVTVGATARMGVIHDSVSTRTENRMRINVSGSGETDGGLTFGAFARFQSGHGPALGATGVMNGSNVWISNGTMTLSMGNIGGAIDQNGGIYSVGGCGFSSSTNYEQYCANVIGQGNATFASLSSGGAGPGANGIARVDFALGSANVSVSGGNAYDTELAATFSLGSATVSVGFDNGVGLGGGTYISAAFDLGSANIGITGFQDRTAANNTSWILKARFAVGSGNIGVFAADDKISGGNRYGINYTQSLGGGATAYVSVSDQQFAGAFSAAGTTVAAGLTFGF
ncbi:MAG: porin [Rhodobacteraceae bacterium]|nr:porin [Paracoccaceae bacterium]